jgi:hypothetical protein
MNYIIGLFLILLTITAYSFEDNFKVIYGEDDRFEPYEVENSSLVTASKSVAALVSNYSLVKYLDSYELATLNFGDVLNYCPNVPFQGQPKIARCSAFLVSPDVVLTAGHCIKSQWDCKSSSFIFDYRIDLLGERAGGQNRHRISKSKVYGCKKILERKLNKETGEDWAIVKLKRKVTDRDYLQIRKYGDIKKEDKLALMGFPSGLPLKIATDGRVREDKNKFYFVAELDAFHINSGSPVINESTLEVEGVLVRGEKDFHNNLGCEGLKICRTGRCRGEDVVKILSIPLTKYIHQK